jgi:hypothetical protein
VIEREARRADAQLCCLVCRRTPRTDALVRARSCELRLGRRSSLSPRRQAGRDSTRRSNQRNDAALFVQASACHPTPHLLEAPRATRRRPAATRPLADSCRHRFRVVRLLQRLDVVPCPARASHAPAPRPQHLEQQGGKIVRPAPCVGHRTYARQAVRGNFAMQWWYWYVIGGCAFVLVIVAHVDEFVHSRRLRASLEQAEGRHRELTLASGQQDDFTSASPS